MNATAFARAQERWDNAHPVTDANEDALERETAAIYADEDRLQGVFEEHYVGVEHDELVTELRELHMLLRANYRRLHSLPDCGEKAENDRAWGELQVKAKDSCLFVEDLVGDEAKYQVETLADSED